MRKFSSRTVISLLLPVLTLSMLVAGPASVSAGSHDGELEEVNVSLQPEYDDPRVLTIVEAKLTEKTPLPRKVEFFISDHEVDPEIGMACELVEGGGHSCKVYDTTKAGDFTSISYGIEKSRDLFFEYYADAYTKKPEAAEGDKSFTYAFRAPADVKTLNIGIQEPLKAEEFVLDPAPATQGQDSEGLKYNSYTYTDVKKDQVFTINANYVKKDPALSKPKSPAQAQGAVAPAAAGGAANKATLPIILLSLAGMSIVAIALLMRGSNSRQIAAPVGPKRTANTGGPARFCAACGSGVSSGSKFCAECGAKT